MTPQHSPASSTFSAQSEEETDCFGSLLATALQAGDVIALDGELGAGKTRLVRALVSSLCPSGQAVSSPTFVLMHRYEAAVPVFHFDVYRLNDVDEFLELGVDEIFDEGGICLIEWAERVAEVLPSERLSVRIRITGPDSREFQLSGHGPRPTAIIESMKEKREVAKQSSTKQL